MNVTALLAAFAVPAFDSLTSPCDVLRPPGGYSLDDLGLPEAVAETILAFSGPDGPDDPDGSEGPDGSKGPESPDGPESPEGGPRGSSDAPPDAPPGSRDGPHDTFGGPRGALDAVASMSGDSDATSNRKVQEDPQAFRSTPLWRLTSIAFREFDLKSALALLFRRRIGIREFFLSRVHRFQLKV